MKQRSPIVVTLLSLFIPFYMLYWLYVTAQDMARRGGKPPRFLLLVLPFIGLAALIPVAMFSQWAGESSRAATNVVVLVFGIVMMLGLIVLPLYYYYKFSESAEHVTNGKVSKIIGFILFLFLTPAAVYIIQDALNNTVSLPSSPSPVPPSPVPYANSPTTPNPSQV